MRSRLISIEHFMTCPVPFAWSDPLVSSPSSRWRGQLTMAFERQPDKTQVAHVLTRSPLRVQRAFYPEDPSVCHTVMVHTAGGMVGGDRLDYQFDLQPQAQALVTTAAAHKVYRSNGALAQQQIQIQAAPGSVLEWLPQETIVFNGAIYRQDLRVDLADGALWLGWDLTRFGRSARGEQFLQGEWRSHTEIWRDRQPLWIDRQSLQASETRWHSSHGLAGQPVIGSFALVGVEVSPDLVKQARHLWSGDPAEIGVTRLMVGMLCRYRGGSTQSARRWFGAVWHLWRTTYLQRTACMPRVW